MNKVTSYKQTDSGSGPSLKNQLHSYFWKSLRLRPELLRHSSSCTHLWRTEMITERKRQSGLRPEFGFSDGTGAGVGVNILRSSRSRNRS